jgi:Mrp family chromosome partitioning ATPase
VEWGEFDYLLFDLAPGAERTFQYAEFLGPETAFLLVTLPSERARGVVARSVAALAEVPNPVLGYVENMAGYYCADCDEVKPLFPSAGEVELPIPCLGRLAFDPELAALCDRGLPSSAGAESPLTRSLAEIADRVALATSTLEKIR